MLGPMDVSGNGPKPQRRKLPDERKSITHKFDIGGHEGYITVGLYEDGQPGELFLTMAKEGSTISGFADAFAQAISYCLQYGVPLEDLVDKFSHVRFEPSGVTKNPDVRFAKSIVDYIFRWVAAKFQTPEGKAMVDELARQDLLRNLDPQINTEEAPPCSTCGSIMVRSGVCYKCSNCGHTQEIG